MHGLDKRHVRFTVDYAEYLELEHRVREAHPTMQNYIRSRLSFPERLTARPDAEERGRQEDEAWERPMRLGLDPNKYFPEEP
jgi:hypothetical protein